MHASLGSAILSGVSGAIPHFFGTRAARRDLSHPPTPGTVQSGTAPFPLVASVKQVHGIAGMVLDYPVRPGQQLSGEWDALVTNQPGVLVTVRTADCVPVLMYDDRTQVVAAVHAGWRGTLGGIVGRIVGLLRRRFATDPEELLVAIGPSIGPCCYEVDEPLVGRVRTQTREGDTLLRSVSGTKARLDLPGLVRQHAVEAGVRPSAIDTIGLCTACRPDLFYSYRRDGRVAGTMVNGIMLQMTTREDHPSGPAI